MTIRRLDHVGIVVDDLPRAIDFFRLLGLELEGEGPVGGDWVDRVIGLQGVRAQIAMLKTPDGHGRVELSSFQAPVHDSEPDEPASNAPGLRHLCFAVEDIDAVLPGLLEWGAALVGTVERYENAYRLCYVRGPAGIIVELAQPLG